MKRRERDHELLKNKNSCGTIKNKWYAQGFPPVNFLKAYYEEELNLQREYFIIWEKDLLKNL